MRSCHDWSAPAEQVISRNGSRTGTEPDATEPLRPKTDLHQTRALIGVLKLFAPSSNHDQFADWPAMTGTLASCRSGAGPWWADQRQADIDDAGACPVAGAA